MVRNMTLVGAAVGSPQRIKSGDLNGKTVDSDRWVNLFEAQSSKTVKYYAGYGVDNRQGNAGFEDLDLQNATPNPIDGEFRWAVYRDANMDDLVATAAIGKSENLRSAVADARTEKPMDGVKNPGAGEEGYIVLEFKADAGSDGMTIDPAASGDGIGVPYTVIRS